MFIGKIKLNYGQGVPIFTKDLLLLFKDYSRAYVFRLIKKAEEDGELIKFTRGVYFLPKESYFGKETISPSKVASNRYITDGDSVYGLYSGLTLLNKFAITSQIPNTVEIITNNEATRKREVDINGITYIVRKSRFEITKENYDYYTILELFLELGINPNLDDISKQLIKEYMKEKNIDGYTLMKLSMNFPAQALKNLIGSGVLDISI